MLRFLLMIGLAISVLSSTASANKPTKREVRKEQKAQAELSERAEIYWRSVRWARVQDASVFIENPNDRLVFQQWLTDQGKDQKITDAKVLRVQVSKEHLKPKDGRIRTAVVTVTIEGYKLPEQLLKQQTVTQAWYRNKSGWFVDWTPPAPPPPKP